MLTAPIWRDQRLADPITGILDAMQSVGIRPVDPGEIIPDGVLRRFRVDGDRTGTRNGWAVLYCDHGAAGTWKGNVTCTWSKKALSRMSRAEKSVLQANIQNARAEVLRQREAEHRQASGRAEAIWKSSHPASPTHPYLVKKRIPPGNARQQGHMLVLRIEDIEGTTRSLQFVAADGSKLMLSKAPKRGHFILAAGTLPADRILIAEGWATASTLSQKFPASTVLAAVDCGNLKEVARNVRNRHPDAEIWVCADDDRLTLNNPGMSAARSAALAVGGKLIRPNWPPGSPLTLTDFNDLASWVADHPEDNHA